MNNKFKKPIKVQGKEDIPGDKVIFFTEGVCGYGCEVMDLKFDTDTEQYYYRLKGCNHWFPECNLTLIN